MKRISYLLSMYSLALLSVLSSCGDKDKDPAPAAAGPSVSPVAKAEYATKDMSLGAGEGIMVAWLAKKADKDMKTFAVTIGGQNHDEFNLGKVKDLSGKQQELYEDEVEIFAPENVGQVATYTFTATDNDGKSGSFSIKLTASSGLKETKGVTFIGDQGTITGKGQFLISTTGKNGGSGSFSASEAPMIDVAYETITATGGRFVSPMDKEKKGTLTGLTATKYAPAPATLDYATATSASLLMAAAPTSTTLNVANGGTYIFEGANGRGLIKVNTLAAGNTGSISFDYKILESSAK